MGRMSPFDVLETRHQEGSDIIIWEILVVKYQSLHGKTHDGFIEKFTNFLFRSACNEERKWEIVLDDGS